MATTVQRTWAYRPAGVDPPRPADMPKCVAPLWPFNRKLGFRFAVAALLLPVGADRITAVMPHHSRRAEADRPPPILQSPTQIDVISRRTKTCVEAVDREKRLFAVRHVAAR